MKKTLMSLGLLGLFVLMASTMVALPVTCDSLVGTGVNITALNNGGAGCVEDGLLFNNFVVNNASSGTGVAEIDVVSEAGGVSNSNSGIYVIGSEVYFNLNPNLGTGTEGGSINDLHLSYTVTGGILNASLSTGGSGAAINEVDCSVATGNNGGCPLIDQTWNTTDLSGQSTVCQAGVETGTGSDSACAVGTASVPETWVFKDISIANPSTSHLTNFTEDYAVPEPATLSLLGAGLLGLGLIRRRMQKK